MWDEDGGIADAVCHERFDELASSREVVDVETLVDGTPSELSKDIALVSDVSIPARALVDGGALM